MIEPLRHNPQTQPITVALRNICRDYPAGGGVLRELLQNADDAGASSVKFVLEQRSYPGSTLVDPKLSEYQGPSLLAYNDATFTEEDFGSLSRIGDSCKLQDGSRTGRFGRGFNAVYNWTDSPSVISGSSLLVLDPHHWWSKRFPNPGGPLYDFVANSKDGAMQDQMLAFSAIMKDFDRPFQGTIIRIPLRTAEQAKQSKICSREASFSDISHVLQKFAQDFGHTGLLFMKNVSSLNIAVGDNPVINIRIANKEQVRNHKLQINAEIKKTIKEGRGNFSSSFEVDIHSGTLDSKRKYRFAIHHSIQNYPEDESLRFWSRDEALVPWVAVASEMGAQASETNSGLLFNVLPSQIKINQPIHIHSCFSMSPDRARLHRVGDNSEQYPLPGRWNHWLFDYMIPNAWADLLLYLAERHPNQPAFEIWPKSQKITTDILYNIDQKVLRFIGDSYPVWYTDIGYVTLKSGLISKVEVSSMMPAAFKEARVPVIYLPNNLLVSIKNACQAEYLTPQKLCAFFEGKQELLRTATEETKGLILHYAMSDLEFYGYGAMEIFPFEDGTYKAINNHVAFVHRDQNEQQLFQFEKNHNIDLNKLSKNMIKDLRHGCSTSSLHPSLRQRSSGDFKSYCLQTHFRVFDSAKDVILADKNVVSFVSNAWDWIITRNNSILDENISCLWLLPLSNGRYRRVKPNDTSFGTILAGTDELGNFLRTLYGTALGQKPIIQEKSLSSRSLELLTDAMRKDSSLLIKSSNSVKDFILWLGEIREVFETALAHTRYHVHKLLASRLSDLSNSRDFKPAHDVLRSIEIFEKIYWKSDNNDMVLHRMWVALKDHHDIVGLRTMEPVPDIGRVTFLNVESDDTERLLNHFKLAELPSHFDILKRFMIPFWGNKTIFESWNTNGKEKITKSLLRNFYSLDDDSRKMVASLPMIPAKRLEDGKANKFATARELIDPFHGKLGEYFFSDEEVYPTDWIFGQYCGVLRDCGLRTELNANLVLDRAKCFAERYKDVQETSKRAQRLLLSTPDWGAGLSDNVTSNLRELRWLPVVDHSGALICKNSHECRGQDEKSLVGYVLPTLDFGIMQDWRSRLGWDSTLPQATLLAQLKHGIEKKAEKVVDAILIYFERKDWIGELCQELTKLTFVVATGGNYVPVKQAFRTGCEKLQPYFYDVDRRFWRNHTKLLKQLGVTEKPSLENLLEIQNRLPFQNQLSEIDIPVAIEMCKLASKFSGTDLSSFRILDGTGILRATEDIVFNDLGMLNITGIFNSTHPDIPSAVIKRLPIEPLSARVKRGDLGIDNADDDEFDQHEDTVAGISDILTRYPIESTFKEFLANADDCKSAKELNWLLDNREHPKSNLLTKELEELQGPALLVHNDGVFEDEHFKGLRQVGQGSKRHDATTIGKFGRGSLTMYHWTDVPMLLSGEWLVILDPQRRVLDPNYRTGGRKKPGVKIKISKLKGTYKHQLTPFENLWGFSQDLDYYPGTIFRFPLRRLTAQSELLENGIPVDFEATRKCLDDFLENDGRMSLLFLRRIKYMDFKIYGDKKPRWSISSDKDWLSVGWTICTITKRTDQKLGDTVKDRWRVAIQDLKLEEGYTTFPDRYKNRRKNVECGLAAFIPEPKDRQKPMFAACPIPTYFSNLPLPLPTDLPIHMHATFLLASDRRFIPVEDSMQEDGAKWNKWLLSQAIPRSYLYFLEDLGAQTQWVKDPLLFWPQDRPSKGHISELVYDAFWQMLPHSLDRIFPVTRQIKSAYLEERRPPELVTAKEGVFDFLQLPMSLALRDVLESQIPKLVRPGVKISEELQRRMTVESITPKRLREIFKNEKASKALELVVASKDSTFLETFLDLITPIVDDEFMELDGCRVLPLADGTFGTLRLCSADHYFWADEKELLLFNFASNILVAEERAKQLNVAILRYKKPGAANLDNKKFNISRITLSSIGRLLECHIYGNKTSRAERDIWLLNFWDYCRRIETSLPNEMSEFISRLDIRSHPIFKASCDNIETYIKPVEMDTLPSIIEPENSNQKSLCRKFPGIYICNSRYMPKYLGDAEKSLTNSISFTRFITTIAKLAKKDNIDLEVYIKKYLEPIEMKLLQDLVVNYVANDPASKDTKMTILLRSFPIWPTMQDSAWITAHAALATESYDLLVPWMDGYKFFIKRDTDTSRISTLKALAVTELSGNELLLTRILPRLHTMPRPFSNYRIFIRAIAHLPDRIGILEKLRQTKLALNRAMILVPASELFDDEDEIFTSAFREEANNVFLAEDVQESKIFWLEIGLHHRKNGQLKPDDYIRCLTTIRRRLEDCKGQTISPITIVDALTVLVPLTMPSIALSCFSKQDWSRLAHQAMFPAQTLCRHELSHRRDKMTSVAAAIPLLELPRVISSQYLPMCWSQISFPERDPTVTTFAHLESNGEPSTAMVWKHLEYMAMSIETLDEDAVAAFLSDIYKTYDFLQEKLISSKESFRHLRRAQVWFNLETTNTISISKADLKLCRCSIENLILESSCDTKSLKSVGQALLRYQRLLRELGCKSIVYPAIQTSELWTDHRVSDWLKRLKSDGVMLDLTLETKGENIRAHKVVMAAASDFFIKQFKEHWLNQDVIDLKPFRHSTISIVVEFAYSGQFDWKSIQVQDNEFDNTQIVENKLDDWLDLLEAANYLFMPILKAEVEKQIIFLHKLYIREHNVLGVLGRASDAEALTVKEYCEQFYARNKEAVDLAVEE